MTQRILIFEGSPPADYLNINKNGRMHPKALARLVKVWRQLGWARYNQLPRREQRKTVGVARVALVIGTRQPGKKRDPMNWYPTIKAFADGLTDAGLWPDDDSRHVTIVEPQFVSTAVLPDKYYRFIISWEEPDA